MKIEQILLWVAGGLGLGYIVTKSRKASASELVPLEGPMPKNQGVPFAEGDQSPVFPLGPSTNPRRGEVGYLDVNGRGHGNASRRFKAERKNNRWHNGIDLYANAGDAVLAPEDGTIVNTQNFLDTIPGDDAVVFAGVSGTVFVLGEVAKNSWKEFGLDVGSTVAKGHPVARVGLTSNDSHMLHFETYTAGTTHNAKWYRNKAAPSNLLDPTLYLLRSMGRV